MSGGEERNRLIVGVTGPVGSGVSAVGTALSNNGFHLLKISTPIKAELRKRDGLSALDPVSQKTVANCRHRLQDIGNEFRQHSVTHWIDAVIKQIPATKDVVIEGLRNTAEAVAL